MIEVLNEVIEDLHHGGLCEDLFVGGILLQCVHVSPGLTRHVCSHTDGTAHETTLHIVCKENYIVQSIKRNLYICAPTCVWSDISTICRPLIRYKWTCQRKHYAKIERKIARQVHKKTLKYDLSYCIHTPVYIWLTFHFVVWLLWFSLVCLLTAHGTNSIDGSDLTAGDICGVGDVYGEYSHWGSRDRVA